MPLAGEFAGFVSLQAGQRALDVGCGTGALTSELVARLGADAVSAVDPSPAFTDATRSRHPTIDIHLASAERLPFGDAVFDVCLGQLVVHFMADPVGGLGEMRRVTRGGGIVGACVWDFGGGHSPLQVFWEAARDLDPEVDDESERAGTRAGQLAALFTDAGIVDVEEGLLEIEVEHSGFEEWWQPFRLGIGPAGAYVQALSEEHRAELEESCRRVLGTAPFTVIGRAWAVRGRA